MSLGLVSALGYNIEASVRALLGALSSFSTKVMIDFRNWNKELIKFLELSTILRVAVGKKDRYSEETQLIKEDAILT